MIPVAVHMTPLRVPPPHGCPIVGRTRIGALTGCWGRRGELLRLTTRDGRTIRFARLGEPFMAWAGAAVSPNGEWLLLQADLPCDSRGAYVVPAAGGMPLTVPKPAQGCDGSQGVALGWTRTNRAVVRFEPEGCTCSLRAGVYALDPRTRR